MISNRRSSSAFASVFRALGYRDYRIFISGQFISLIGTWMQNVAQAWLVYRLTGSSLLLGAVGFVNQIPIMILSPIAGALADRLDRRRIVIASQVCMLLLAFTLAGLTLGGWIRMWQILALAALLGVAVSFDIPARQSLFIEMVGKTDLINAIALNSSVFNGARIIGPAIAGILVAAIGEGWCFFGNGVSYFAVIAGLLMLRTVTKTPAPPVSSALADVVEGFRYVWHTGPVHALLALLGLVSLVGMPYSVLMPVFADRILHGGAKELGLLMGASGLGALIGALAVAARRGVRGLGRWVALSSAGFGVTLIVFSLSRWFWLSAILLVPVGFTLMVQMAASNTLIQTMIPDVLRGRVMALYSMMLLGMAPFGALFAGAAAERLGAPVTVAAGGVVCVVGSAVFWYRWPSLRVAARELIVAQQVAGGEPVDVLEYAGMSTTEALIEAIKAGDDARVGEILAASPNVRNNRSAQGETPVLAAAYRLRNDLVERLLAAGAEIDIYEAAAVGHSETVRRLARERPELVNSWAPDGFTPLGLASFFGQEEIVMFLLASGAQVNAASKNDMQVMPLHSAVAARRLTVARLLLEHGADVGATQEAGFTPLHSAANNGQEEMVRLLLGHGADVNAKSPEGVTPLQLALERGHSVVAGLLGERGAI